LAYELVALIFLDVDVSLYLVHELFPSEDMLLVKELFDEPPNAGADFSFSDIFSKVLRCIRFFNCRVYVNFGNFIVFLFKKFCHKMVPLLLFVAFIRW